MQARVQALRHLHRAVGLNVASCEPRVRMDFERRRNTRSHIAEEPDLQRLGYRSKCYLPTL